MKFSELNLHEKVLAGIKNAGFEECMPVQERALPVALSGKDLMVQSKTGSGKTAVFVIAFLEEYLRKKDAGISSSCLIVAPTRELAQQIADDASVLCSGVPGFHVGCFFGGTGYERQRKLLQMGCDIYVGTPGRLLDFMGSGDLKAKNIDTFVIDEADRLFDMGFYPDIKKMFRMMVPREQRQTMLFSATLEMRVRELAWEYMNESEEIELEPDTITVDSITQELYHVAKSEKLKLLLQLLALEQPESAIIFTNSRHMTMELSRRLRYNGWNADYISGDLTQKARELALSKLKNGKIKILVATDVAARGLQIDNLPLVVNYDIPEDYENYVHRIGRTARAGKSGKAITLADEEFVYGLEAIEKYIKMKIPVIWPDNLPEITVKTAPDSRSIKKDVPRQSGSRPKSGTSGKTSSGKPSSSRKDSARQDSSRPAAQNRTKSDSRSGKSLGRMTEAERMKYYKDKYGFEPSKTASTSKESKEEKKEPVKKPGFWARLFGIGRKKK